MYSMAGSTPDLILNDKLNLSYDNSFRLRELFVSILLSLETNSNE